jgi:hypothetical protein
VSQDSADVSEAFLTLTDMDTGVRFYHLNDERAFFEWLGRIPCVESYVGEGRRGLVVSLASRKILESASFASISGAGCQGMFNIDQSI